MLLLNFGSKIGQIEIEQINALSHDKITEWVYLPVDPYNQAPFQQQLSGLYKKAKLTNEDFMKQTLVLNLPASALNAAIILADIHGRTGKFPLVIRLRPAMFGIRVRSDVVDLLDLNSTHIEMQE
jgi:hypothetical protein